MRLKDLKDNEKLFLHFTLTDTCLFAKSLKDARKIEMILDQNVYEENKAEFQRLLNGKGGPSPVANDIILAKKDRYFKEHFLEVIEQNEDLIDVDKFLLVSAYRIRNLLALLEDEKNRSIFPHFDSFMPYRKVYAETAEEINRLLAGRNVRVSYKAVHGKMPSGYWDEIKQGYVDMNYTSSDLERDLESGPIKRALALEKEVTELELDDFSSRLLTLPTGDIEIAPKDIREFAENMAKRNPNIKMLNLESVGGSMNMDKIPELKPSNPLDLLTDLANMMKAEDDRVNKIVTQAFVNNGITKLGRDKYVAVYEGEEVEIPLDFLDILKDVIRKNLKEIHDIVKSGKYDESIIVDIIQETNRVLTFDMENERELQEIYFECADTFANRADTDEEFGFAYLQTALAVLDNLRNKIVYDSSIVPKEYINKHGEDTAMKMKYDEIQTRFRDNMIYLCALGVLPTGVLIEEGSIPTDMTHKELLELVDNGLLDKTAVRDIIFSTSGKVWYEATDEEKDDYIVKLYKAAKADKKLKNKSSTRKYLDIVTDKRILEIFILENGTVDESVLRRNNVEPVTMFELDADTFVEGIKCGKLHSRYIPEEREIIELYGSKLEGKHLIDLAENKKIKDSAILKAYVFGKSLELDEDFEPITHDDLVKFYDVNRLLNMLDKGDVNPRFIELFNKEVLDKLPEEERKLYFENVVNSLKEIDEKNGSEVPEYLTSLYRLYKAGLYSKEDIKDEFTYERLEELILDDKISEDDVVELFNDGLTGLKTIKELYTDDKEIASLVKIGKLNIRAILAIKSKREKYIKDLLESDKMDMQGVLDLYLDKEDALDIIEFEKVLKDKEIKPGMIVDLIPDDITPEKIEELFKRYYISADDLVVLSGRNLIDVDKVKELKDYLNGHEEYEKIFGNKSRVARLTNTTETPDYILDVPPHPINPPGPGTKKKLKNDPELQEAFLEALGADPRVITLTGTDNSLDGYKVYGFEDLGIMVFGKFDKPDNSTYVMTIAQGSYYINTLERNSEIKKDGKEEAEELKLESIATKQNIRNSENVKVKNASRAWGTNIINAMKELNPDVKEKLKKNDRYNDRIKELVEEIALDYDLRKLER